MYAVIQTGGKQYRVQPGDLRVVEKLEGEPGAEVAFDRVLMLGGEGGAATVGAPVVEGAVVRATLIETRKGEKVHGVKKIRRQGYRRTLGHRQLESVLRITGLEGAGVNQRWDGEVDLTPRAVLVARARGLAPMVETAAVQARPARAPTASNLPATLDDAQSGEVALQEAAVQAEAAPKPARARKPKDAAAAQADAGALVEPPISETPADAAQTVANPEAQAGVGAQEGTEAPKKPRARKPKTDAAPEGGEA
jgi:large subunit ribosomal protein L21